MIFHGAGGTASGILELLGPAIDNRQAVIVALESVGSTWDALTIDSADPIAFLTGRRFAGFGPDITYLNRALEQVFRTVAIDHARVSAVGFSDGASYALSVGLINGDLFRKIVALSPGFIVNGPRQGRPGVFVSHGRQDRILPIDRAGRLVVSALRAGGYDVTYREYDGGHMVPPNIAREAITWALE